MSLINHIDSLSYYMRPLSVYWAGLVMNKLYFGLASGLVAIVVAILGLYFASPWMAVSALAQAASKGDKAKIEAMVDFPSVKDGLKSQLNAVMMKAMAESPELQDNPFAGLAIMMAPQIVNNVVDMMVTADGIASMATRAAPSTGQIVADEERTNPSEKPNYSMSYVTLDRFRSRISQPNDAEKYMDFMFQRKGLFGWKLVKVDMSAGLLDELGNHAEDAG